MKIIFHVCLLFCFFAAQSQTDDSLHFSKFDLGFSFSPDYSYRTLKTSSTDEASMKNIYDTSEVARFSFTAGFNVIYHVNKKLFISSGVLFCDKGEKTKKYLVLPVNNYVNHYYYLSVPVKVNYYIIDTKKIKFFIGAGLSADIYLNSQSNVASGISQDKKPVSLSSKVSRLNLAFNGGLGIDCPITERWYFKLQPDYRISITSVAKGPLKKYFYSAGINLGFFCKIKSH